MQLNGQTSHKEDLLTNSSRKAFGLCGETWDQKKPCQPGLFVQRDESLLTGFAGWK